MHKHKKLRPIQSQSRQVRGSCELDHGAVVDGRRSSMLDVRVGFICCRHTVTYPLPGGVSLGVVLPVVRTRSNSTVTCSQMHRQLRAWG